MLRGPFLIELEAKDREILNQAASIKKEELIKLGDEFIVLVMRYIEKFQEKSCCFTDLKKHLKQRFIPDSSSEYHFLEVTQQKLIEKMTNLFNQSKFVTALK